MSDPSQYMVRGSYPQYTSAFLQSQEDERPHPSTGIARDLEGDETLTNDITNTSTVPSAMPNTIPTRETSYGMPFQNQNWNGSGFSALSANSRRPSFPGLNNDSHLQDFGGVLQSPQPLPTRKRQRDNYGPGPLLGESPDPKSRKPTPVGMHAAVASSSSSRPPSRLSESNGGDLGELLGLSDGTFSDVQREQLEVERQVEERREQERRDAEFARFLEDGGEQSCAISASPAPSVSTLASLPPVVGSNTPFATGRPPYPGKLAAGSGYTTSTPRRVLNPQATQFVPKPSNQVYIDISSDSDDIQEIRSSDFPARNLAPGLAPTPDTSSWNVHREAVIDGRSWPTIDSSYSGVKREERILGPAGPRSLEAKSFGAFPIAPWQTSYDSIDSWRNLAMEAGQFNPSMPGAFPTDGPGQYPMASVGIGFPRPG